jgi:hypothetical protein
VAGTKHLLRLETEEIANLKSFFTKFFGKLLLKLLEYYQKAFLFLQFFSARLCAYSTVVGRPVLCLLPLGGLVKLLLRGPLHVCWTPTTQHLLDSMNRKRIDN